MAQNHFLAGVGRALIFAGDNLIGVAKTLTESTFNFSISSEDVRGGSANALWGKYFHDSNLQIQLTDAMFKLEYVAANLGVDIAQGGLTVYESAAAGDTVVTAGQIALAQTPVAFDGTVIGWYKKPADLEWSIGTISDNIMTIPGSQVGDTYCVKYFYQNPNARSIQINTQYIPKVWHLVILNDLFAGDVADIGSASRYGRIVTDIPRYQLDGNMTLNLTATSASTVPINGNALAVETGDSCEEEPYYGTMTEEIFGASWQDNVIALAIENSDLDLVVGGSDTLIVRAVFGGATASARQNNTNFTFTVESGTSAAVNSDGLVTASAAGDTVISVALRNKPEIVAYATVTVTAD
jgi:hypothetical protein